MDKKLQEILDRDPVAEVEAMFGPIPRDPAKASPELSLAFLGHAMSVNSAKQAALESRDDANYMTTVSGYQRIITDMGFRKVLELPFVGKSYYGKPSPQELFCVYWRDEGGVLLYFDTFNGKRINSGKFCYNWKPTCDRNGTYSVLSSGGWHTSEPMENQCPSYDEMNDEDDNPKNDPEVASRYELYKEEWCRKAVWSGDHDAREAIRHNMERLEEFGKFVTPWTRQPFLYLLHYMDTKQDGYDYKAITAERIKMLPADVQSAIDAKSG